MTAPQAVLPLSVLVVDNEPLVLRLMERALTEPGYRLQSASNGLRALELARQWSVPPDVLVTDVRMEGSTGSNLPG